MSDHGGQPTSPTFRQPCATLAIPQTCTSDHTPQGYADTERFMRTLKEECLWLQAWTCPVVFVSALDTWINDDHTQYRHSALGDNTPRQFERDDDISHSTPCVAA
jgi:putative transposase